MTIFRSSTLIPTPIPSHSQIPRGEDTPAEEALLRADGGLLLEVRRKRRPTGQAEAEVVSPLLEEGHGRPHAANCTPGDETAQRPGSLRQLACQPTNVFAKMGGGRIPPLLLADTLAVIAFSVPRAHTGRGRQSFYAYKQPTRVHCRSKPLLSVHLAAAAAGSGSVPDVYPP